MAISGCAHPKRKSKTAPLVPPGKYSSEEISCQHGVVVSISRPASDVGVSIMKQGGNAVDAAVATAFALAVTYPAAGNIGGGGFMIVHPPPGKGQPTVFDYRECAPVRSMAHHVSQGRIAVFPAVGCSAGHRSRSGVGTSAIGTLPWSQLLQPAIVLARDGFPIQPFWRIC